MMKLYYAKGTAALPVHILLEEVGADYSLNELSFAEKEQTSDDYLAVNPKGRVPSLVTDRGTLTETPAILAFLAQTHPEAGLTPADPFGFAEAQAFNAYLCATVHVNHAHKQRGARWTADKAAHEAMRAEVPRTMTESMAMIETHMLRGPWVLGERYSMCDPYLLLASRWAEADGVDLSAFPAIAAHAARTAERPAVRRALKHHV